MSRSGTWEALPSEAYWYGEVTFSSADGYETDYNYGYSTESERPDTDTLDELVPEGYYAIERAVLATGKGDRWLDWASL